MNATDTATHGPACLCVDCETEARAIADRQAREDDSADREARFEFAPQHPFAGVWGE